MGRRPGGGRRRRLLNVFLARLDHSPRHGLLRGPGQRDGRRGQRPDRPRRRRLAATRSASSPTGINAMIAKIQAIVGKVRESSLQLLSTASEIAATARQQEATVQGLSSLDDRDGRRRPRDLRHQQGTVRHHERSQRTRPTRRPTWPTPGRRRLGEHGADDAAARRIDRVDLRQAGDHPREGGQHQRGGDDDHQGRRPDEPAVDQRRHRGGEGRRVRPRVPGGGPRDPPAGRPDRGGDARHRERWSGRCRTRSRPA